MLQMLRTVWRSTQQQHTEYCHAQDIKYHVLVC